MENGSETCYGTSTVEMCKAVASYYLMNATIDDISEDTVQLGNKIATDIFHCWVS